MLAKPRNIPSAPPRTSRAHLRRRSGSSQAVRPMPPGTESSSVTLRPCSVSSRSGRMTRGTSFLNAGERCELDQFGGLAQVEPARDPFRLFAFHALAVKQIDRAIELQQHAPERFDLLRQRRPEREWGRRDPPIVIREQALPARQARPGRSARAARQLQLSRSRERFSGLLWTQLPGCWMSWEFRLMRLLDVPRQLRTCPLPIPIHL